MKGIMITAVLAVLTHELMSPRITEKDLSLKEREAGGRR